MYRTIGLVCFLILSAVAARAQQQCFEKFVSVNGMGSFVLVPCLTPTPIPSPQPTATPTPLPSPSPVSTPTPPQPTPTPTPLPSPTPLPTPIAGAFYVSTTGFGLRDGTLANPWDLQTAFNQTVKIVPGSTVYIRGGTYPGKFISRLAGTAATRIDVRPYPGETFKLEGYVHSTLANPLPTGMAWTDVPCKFTSNLGLPSGAAVWVESEVLMLTRQQPDGMSWTCTRGWAGQPVSAHPAGAEAYSPDNVLTAAGSYTWFWEPEILDSNPKRMFAKDFGGTTFAIRSGGFNSVQGVGNKLIIPVIHDTSTGVFANEGAVGLEVIGAILFNCGFVDFSRGHGQCIYLANDPAVQKAIRATIAFNGFSNCAKFYSSSGMARNFLSEDYIAFGCGVSATAPGNQGQGPGKDLPLGNRDAALFVGANGPNKATNDITIRRNYFYEPPNSTGDPTLWAGYYEGVGSTGLSVIDSRVMGGSVAFATAFKTLTVTGNKFHAQANGSAVNNGALLVTARLDPGFTGTWNNNTYFDQTPNEVGWGQLPFLFSLGGTPKLSCRGAAQLQWSEPCLADPSRGGWKDLTGFDSASQYNRGAPTGVEVFVIPIPLVPGRAHIAIYNWDKNPSVNVDLSGVLVSGDKFDIKAVEDLFGPSVASGTYSGSPVPIPMNGTSVAAPIGLGWIPPTTRPTFGAFLVRKQ